MSASPARPPKIWWFSSLIIPLVLLLGLSNAHAVQPTQANLTKTLWLGGDHYPPLIAPIPKGAFQITGITESPCGSYSSGASGLSAGCTNVWQIAPGAVDGAFYAAAETGVQYNTTQIGVRRESVSSTPVAFNRSALNIFTGSAKAHNHIIAGHITYNLGLSSGAPSKMAKRGNARFKLDVTSNGEWELRFIAHRRGVLARTAGLTNEARIGAWSPNMTTSPGITIQEHNLGSGTLAAQGGSGLLVLANQVTTVNQSTSELFIKGKGSGTILLDADFDMFVDAGDIIGLNALLSSSACWLGGSAMNYLNSQITASQPNVSSAFQSICKTNTALNENQGLELQVVKFLADFDDDGIKDDVDNCTNTKNPSQFDANSDGTGDACDGSPPSAPTNLAINAAGTVVTGKAQPESTVSIYSPTGALLGTVVVPTDGNFSATINPAQLNGQVLRVNATDSAGTSPNASVTAPDTVPPAVPTNVAINGTGTVVTGQAQIGSTVEVKDPAGNLIGSQVVPASGSFSITLNPAQTDGQVLAVTAKDPGGTSPAVNVTAPDLGPPPTPTDLAVNTSGTEVTGKAEPGSTIQVKGPNGVVIGNGNANASGDFSVAISPAQVNGELLSVTAADAGGTSVPGTVTAPDTIAPSAPLNAAINATGTIVTGQAQAGSTVEVKDPAGTIIGSEIVPASGSFTITLNPAQTDGQILAVTARDAGGTSPAVNVTAPDLAAPATPTNLAVNATGSVVTGKAEADSTIEIKDPAGVVIGTGTANSSGDFSITISPAQTDGELLSVTAADGGGKSAPATLNAPDLAPPASPTQLAVNATGTVVTGKAEAGSTIEVKDPSGNPIGTATADTNGDFSVNISPAQTGAEVLSVTATDGGGTSAPATVTAPDLDAPDAPTNLVVNSAGTRMTGDAQAGSLVIIKDPNGVTIGSGQAGPDGKFDLALSPAQVNGELLSVTATDNAGTSLPATVLAPDTIPPSAPLQVTINGQGTIVYGQAQPGSTVEVRDPAGDLIGTATVSADGNFDVTLNPAQTNAEVLAVTASDSGGTSPVVNVTAPDLTPPNAPLNPVVNATGTEVSGKAQPGSTVEVKDPAGNPIGSGQADANGDFTIVINPAQTNGEVLKVTATDAGGTSPAADAQAPDSTPPATPVNPVVNATGTAVTGQAQPGSTIEVKDPAGNPIGSGQADANGDFTVAINPAQTNGEVLKVTATDTGGTSPAVDAQAPDLTAPTAPLQVTINDQGTIVSGQAQPGSTVEVRDPAGALIGTATVAADGNFDVTLNPAQTNAQVLAVTASDLGGTSPVVNVTAPDLTAPAAPQTAVVNATGTQVSGKAQPGSTVEVKDPAGNLLGSATADANGDYVVSISPAQTNGEVLKVTAKDAGGTSPATDAQAPDLEVPAAPTNVQVSADGTQVTGKAEPNTTIEVKDPSGTSIGTGTTDMNGDFTVMISPAQIDGEELAVTASDAAGTSAPATAQAPDTQAPDSPTGLIVAPDGSSVTGKAEPGSTIDVKDPAGNPIGSGTADENGDFTVPLTPPQTNGETLDVTAADGGGASAPAQVQAPDNTAPNAPADVAVSPDGTQVTGKAEPGSTIEVKDPAGNPIGSGQADANGDFTVVITPAQTNAEVLDVTATDTAGNESDAAQASAPDLTPPAAPQTAVVNAVGTQVSGKAQPGSTVEVKDPAGNSLGSAAADANGDYVVSISPAQTNGEVLKVTATDAGGTSPATDAQAPDLDVPAAPTNVQVSADGTQVTGKAEPGTAIEVKDPSGTLIGTGTTDANGDFTVAISPAQIDGELLAVTASDAAGTSAPATAQAPDTQAPDSPTGLIVAPDGSSVTGKAEPGSTIEVKDPAGNPIGSGTADANGDFTVPLTPPQANGETLDVTAADGGGQSAPSQVQAPDNTAPNAPADVAVSPDGTQVTGKAEPGSTIEVKDPAGNPIGSGQADANGDFTVAINPAQTNGEVLQVTATDVGGTSPPTDAQAPDLTAPTAPLQVTINGQGTVVSGKAQAGSTVEVKDPTGALIGTVTVPADGNFDVTLNPAQTNGEVLAVTAKDAGGTSPAVNVTAPDMTAPDAPRDLVVTPDGTAVTGKAEPGATVEVKGPDGTTIGTATADGNGDFTVPLTPAQTNGETLDVNATDAAGNPSAPAQVDAPDTTAPDAPRDLVVTPDGTAVTGKAEPGATIEVKGPDGTTLGTATADGNGDFTVPLTPAQTNGQLLDVTATDASNNPSAPAQVQAPLLPPPGVPTDLAVGANGASVTGKAEAGSTVTIKDPSGAVIGTAIADAGGNFYATISPPQVMGQVLTVTAANAYGVSPAANVTAPNLDEELEAGVLMRAWGEFVKDKFGHAIAAGDIDGDGHLDVVVGAPHYSRVIPGTTKKIKKVGRVYVYSGRNGRLMLTLDGEVKGDWFGHSVAVLDFDGDGQLDIAVGAPRAKPSPALRMSGKVYVYSGADGSLLATALGEARGQQLGTTMVSLLHDTEADLLAVSAPKAKSAAGLARAGYVSVIGFDAATSSKAKEVYRIDGELRQEQLGTVQAVAPDLTGDGYAELAIGLPKANSLSASGKFGVVRVYSTEVTSANSRLIATVDGAQLPATAAGAPRKGDLFGSSVATVDDMDGDGIGELLIGAPGFDPVKGGKRVNNAGAAFVVSSSMLQVGTTQANVLASYYGEAKKDQFGWAVANGGALQAGGEVYHFIAAKGVDVIIANPKNGKPMKANDAGALYGYKAGAAERSFKRTGSAKKAHYGNVLLAVGDVDKDGYTDVITASPFMSRYTPLNRKWLKNLGFVEVYSGEFIVNRPTP